MTKHRKKLHSYSPSMPPLEGRPIVCSKCGGSRDTLVKIGESLYAHSRDLDCKIQRARNTSKAVSHTDEVMGGGMEK